jgi:predicted dehydrogenase
MSERWKALVIGCGRIGGTFNAGQGDAHVMTHALAYRRHPGFELAACVEPDAARREEFMRRWGVDRGYASLDEALAADRYDIVSVANSTDAHLATLDRLRDAPVRALFVEKPIGADPARAAPLVRHFAARGIPFAVNFQRRWDGEMHRLRDEIRGGEWGALRVVVGRYMRGIVNNAGHMVNLLAFLLGETPRAVAASHPRWDGVAGDPTVDARLELADGTPVHLVGSEGRDWAVFDTTLSFAKGEVVVEKFGFQVRRRRPRPAAAITGVPTLDDGTVTDTRYGEAMLRALDEIRAWKPGMRLASDGESALETLAVNDRLRAMALAGTKETR